MPATEPPLPELEAQAAGMHWTVNGADSIIALRCREASSQWEAICDNRNNQTGAA